MIKFLIVRNKLPANPTGYVARVRARDVVGLEEIARRIALLGTTVSEADVLNVIRHYNEITAELLSQGDTILTPAVRYRVSIRGVFTDESDPFDSARHLLTARLTPGPLLQEALRKAPAERYDVDPAAPYPKTFVDSVTEARNGTATPGREGWLIGTRLHFNPQDPAQGIYFIDSSGTETKVEGVGWNKANRLMFIVPALAAGDYHLEVRAAIGTRGVQVGWLDAVLHVA